MSKPIITAKQLADGLLLAEGTTQMLSFDYCDGTVPYTARLKVSRNADGVFVACCTCGRAVRQLHKHPTRIGLCCIDCLSRAEHRDAERLTTPTRKKAV